MNRKRDLIYIRPSINHCQMMKQFNRKNHRLLCMAELNDNNNDTNNDNDWKNQWPPIESCDKLCCNRGYQKRIRLHQHKCQCIFQFCCSIICKSSCSTFTTEYECNDNDNNDNEESGVICNNCNTISK
ncbi:hypothetical protein BLA29_005409 [Euroglyphus maynei]|uniref:Protein Wnt n=1 Tax=Euroglyphus maynei TaxID=6958 RepID=A0A1Y3BIE3_EURMA|nr:hypothetical protein BLA29_005409 [Euroglyphus maynei]